MRALRFAAMLAVIGAATPPETFRYVYEAPRPIGAELGRRARSGEGSDVQACDSTCWWCARWFFAWLKGRMYNAQRETGRSGEGSFADAAATSVGAER